MRSYVKLIKEWESFLRMYPEGDLEQFGHWLVVRSSNEVAEEAAVYQSQFAADQQAAYGYSPSNARAPHLFWRLYKISKMYSKPILDEVGLKSIDEFAILTYIHRVGESTKTEAIEEHYIDRSTGIDMIKRFIRRGILVDRVSPQDRRARLVSLSREGEELLHQVYLRLSETPEVLVNMSPREQELFIRQLQALDDAHTAHIRENLFKNKKK